MAGGIVSTPKKIIIILKNVLFVILKNGLTKYILTKGREYEINIGRGKLYQHQRKYGIVSFLLQEIMAGNSNRVSNLRRTWSAAAASSW